METSEVEQYVEKHYRHNFTFNLLDVASFMFGLSFYSSSVILPLYVRHFTQNPLIIGLIPTLGTAGFLVPQLFTSNWVERLPRKIDVPLYPGFFLERVPIFLMAPTAWLFAVNQPIWALVTVLFFYGLGTFGSGFTAVAWQDMLAKVIPLRRRGFFLGLTNFVGMGTGIFGAAGAAWLLGRFPFPTGYVWCFGIGAVMIFNSWLMLAQVREPSVPSTVKLVSQLQYFRSLPAVLRNDRNFSNYLISSVVVSLSGMASGFMVIYAAQRWQLSDERAGTFSVAMLAGQALASLLLGMLADRRGFKLVMEISVLLSVASIGLSFLAPAPEWFYLVYILRGGNVAGMMLSGMMIAMEFSPADVRPTYIGLANTLPGIAGAVGPLFAGWLAGMAGYPLLFVVAFIIGTLGISLLHWTVHDPRHTQKV